MPMKLDAKFCGEVRKAKDDSVVPEDEWMVFLAQDNAFPSTLEFYLNKCIKLGCDADHIAAIERTIDRLYAWRDANPDKLKDPDAAGEKLIG
jgi:hypothetical protein